MEKKQGKKWDLENKENLHFPAYDQGKSYKLIQNQDFFFQWTVKDLMGL